MRPGADLELAGGVAGAVSETEILGQAAVANRKRLEPLLEVDASAGDLGRAGPAIFNQNFAPGALFRVEVVESLQDGALQSLAVAGRERPSR